MNRATGAFANGSPPYRVPGRFLAGPVVATYGLESAQLAAKAFLVGWSVLRVLYCSLHEFDIEGSLALVIVAATGWSLIARRSYP